jgi:ubiquinone/menaquinone biosynthesis C-methylase UbiE
VAGIYEGVAPRRTQRAQRYIKSLFYFSFVVFVPFVVNIMFRITPQLEDGIYKALAKRPRLPPAQASNFLPLTATLYEPLWRKRSLSIITLGEFNVERELELMLEWLQPQAGQTILDAACSAGLYARTLLKYVCDSQTKTPTSIHTVGEVHEPPLRTPNANSDNAKPNSTFTVHAVDYSLPFLKKAKEYAEREKLSPVLVQADVSNLPYGNEVFDALVCGGSLNEFLDVPKVMRECSRVLKPGGKMWQMYLKQAEEPIGKTIQGLLRLSGIRFLDPKTFEQQCSEAGLNLIKAQHRGRVVMALFQKDISPQRTLRSDAKQQRTQRRF